MIYCVEDDDDIRELELYTLKTAGFESQGFADAADFWQAMQVQKPDLILLDIMLPGSSGLSILEELEENSATTEIPVIMATAKGTEFDKVKGLDMGADDYLVKPFGMMEMISRIKAVLRRSQKNYKPKQVRFGNLLLDVQNYVVKKDNQVIHLTLKEFELLALLMQNPNRVFTRQDLLEQIWGVEFLGETRTVDVHIGTLRTKLGDASHFIQTIRGVGYRLEDDNG
ncbi:two-component system, OmpR family, alkaline phosphatase synthesis response regulator PhoP [Streptococcus equinus]|uniref:Two-component system, OmpR family, alkaline phosphatase synthesis response regulator PhoP n=1 Tax=Streptococcus equinus TaxID=1335 RepID=A0A1H0ZJ28_STREI|nr:response regulator transcription factor [Streptococcus equinus]SDQ27453.1 two-component system, OmpR family, alkaline phosphatase synthesis response regulator PhoP [Streptococcus equinus]